MTNKKDKKKPCFQFIPKDTSTWIFLIIFVSAWMFGLGVLVGRDTVPVKFDIEKLHNELVALKKAVIRKEQKRFKIDSAGVKNKTNFDFYEVLKETKQYNGNAEISGKQETKHVSQKTALKVGKNLVSNKTKPVEVRQLDKKKTNKTLTIQVAAFKNLKDADNIVAKLIKKGYTAYRISSSIPEKGIWHRVRIGYFKDKADADSTLNKLKKEKFKAILVNR